MYLQRLATNSVLPAQPSCWSVNSNLKAVFPVCCWDIPRTRQSSKATKRIGMHRSLASGMDSEHLQSSSFYKWSIHLLLFKWWPTVIRKIEVMQAEGILIGINKMSGMLSAKTLHAAIPTTFRDNLNWILKFPSAT